LKVIVVDIVARVNDGWLFESRTNRAWEKKEKAPCMMVRIWIQRVGWGSLAEGKDRGSGIDSGRPLVCSSTRNRGTGKT